MRTGHESHRAFTRICVALAVALVAGVAFVLGVAAMVDVDWDPRGAVILAIAAIWIPQTLITAARHRRN